MTTINIQKTSILSFALTAFSLLALTNQVVAQEVTANSCSRDDIQAAVDEVEAAGGGTVFVPAGECAWDSDAQQVNINSDTSIIGAGVDSTIIQINRDDYDGVFYFGDENYISFARVSGFSFFTNVNTGVIKYRQTYSFRVDHCQFEANPHMVVPIGWKNLTKGLIDHCTFTNHNEPYAGSYYGPGAGSTYAGNKPEEDCDEDICRCFVGDEGAGPRSGSVPSGYTVINNEPAVIDNAGGAGQGTVRRIYLEIASVGANPYVNVAAFSRSGNIFTARARTTDLAVVPGKNIFTVDDGEFAAFAIHQNDYIGVYLNDCELDASSDTADWVLGGDQTNESSVDFGDPSAGHAAIGAELFDDEGDYTNCEAQWDDWWDDVDNLRPSYSGFEEDFDPASDQAVYFEDNSFDWYKAAIEFNWGNGHAAVVRHNTFKNTSGEVLVGFKPGTIYAIIHNNTFEHIGDETGGYAIRLRCSGMVYNNTLINLNYTVKSNAFRSNGFYFTHQVRTDEMYIFNNIYENCKYGADGAWGGIGGGGDYAVSGVGENGTVHLRAPQSGDRLFDYGYDYSQSYLYPYPHPLACEEEEKCSVLGGVECCDNIAYACDTTPISGACDCGMGVCCPEACVPIPDAGQDGDTLEGGGCGCHTTGSAGHTWPLIILPLLLFVFTRRS